MYDVQKETDTQDDQSVILSSNILQWEVHLHFFFLEMSHAITATVFAFGSCFDHDLNEIE